MGVKGILLAGGVGTRLWPVTRGISKQLLPVYDKPMVYYPLGTLMLAGIREIAIITTIEDQPAFKRLLGDGSKWGIHLTFIIQDLPNGIAEAFLLAENFLMGSATALILGDNIFNGSGIGRNLQSYSNVDGAQIFAYQVSNPEEFGVIEIDKSGAAIDIIEKPLRPKSDLAVPGLYFYSSDVVEKAKNLVRSERGELEITALNLAYLKEGRLSVSVLPRGTAWLDGGTVESLHDAAVYIRVLEQRQGLKIGCVEEIAWRNGWISDSELSELAEPLLASGYGKYLASLVKRGKN
jgi:glucose-1-phosphate thymidylyltransferase